MKEKSASPRPRSNAAAAAIHSVSASCEYQTVSFASESLPMKDSRTFRTESVEIAQVRMNHSFARLRQAILKQEIEDVHITFVSKEDLTNIQRIFSQDEVEQMFALLSSV
jgi:hypothetical protein